MIDRPARALAEMDPADPYARPQQIQPRLTAEQMRHVADYGTEQAVADGTVLFTRGERGVDFFVVLDGAIEIFEVEPCGDEHVIATHHAGQFSGEMDLFNDRQILVSARARGQSRVLRIGRTAFRRLIAGDPDLSEIVMRAFILRRVGFIRHADGGVLLIGAGHAGDTQRLARFLIRNGYPYRMLDTEQDPDVAHTLRHFQIEAEALPAVIMDGAVLTNPTTAALADAIGLTEALDPAITYDVAVVGAGPAGLAAAVYAASEGLSTIVLESTAPGGQAGTSSRIENYLGFPTGISGQALAGRAQSQAQKFGAKLAIARRVTGLDCTALPYRLQLEDGAAVRACSVVLATGARYRRLAVEQFDRFEGQGIHYAATRMEAQLCGAEEVCVVGGGNSAGQATMFLSRTVGHVHVLVRSTGLAATMSDYLVQRIAGSPKVTVHAFTEITALEGDALLRRITWTDRRTGVGETKAIGNLFVMIGAEPNTEWLDGCLTLDQRGFVVTGRDANGMALASPFATTRPGVFAVGDVRAGSVKRVASGVGEGSVVVQAIHQYLTPGVA